MWSMVILEVTFIFSNNKNVLVFIWDLNEFKGCLISSFFRGINVVFHGYELMHRAETVCFYIYSFYITL